MSVSGHLRLLDNAVVQILKTKLTFLSQLVVREKSHFTSGFFSTVQFSGSRSSSVQCKRKIKRERSFTEENASDEVSRKAVKSSVLGACLGVQQQKQFAVRVDVESEPENERAHCAALILNFRRERR